MNRYDVIEMALKSNLVWRSEAARKNLDPFVCNWLGGDEELFNFAALVAAAEREACAKACYEIAGKGDAFDCMDAIRARGEKL